jgi:hypothetical protein
MAAGSLFGRLSRRKPANILEYSKQTRISSLYSAVLALAYLSFQEPSDSIDVGIFYKGNLWS